MTDMTNAPPLPDSIITKVLSDLVDIGSEANALDPSVYAGSPDGTAYVWIKHSLFRDAKKALESLAHPSVAGMPDEPTEEMVEAAIATFGGIVGTPENLAKPEYVERMKDRQRKAVIEHYKAMHSAYVRALGEA